MFKIISVVIGFLLLGLDQWSKQWAITHLEGAGTVPALPGLFNFDFFICINTCLMSQFFQFINSSTFS